MAKFVTIGYGDRAGYERTAPEVRNAAHAHDKELRKRGALMGVAGVLCKYAIPTLQGFRQRVVRSCRHLYPSPALPSLRRPTFPMP